MLGIIKGRKSYCFRLQFARTASGLANCGILEVAIQTEFFSKMLFPWFTTDSCKEPKKYGGSVEASGQRATALSFYIDLNLIASPFRDLLNQLLKSKSTLR